MKIRVNSETISPEVIQREIQNYRQQNLGVDEKEAFAEVSQRMVEWALIRQAAEASELSVTPEEIEEEFEKLCQSHGGKEQFFQRFGLTEASVDDVKRDVAGNRKVAKFLDRLSGDVELPGEELVIAYYEANAGKFMHPEKVHVVHIVKHPQGEDAEQIAATVLTNARNRLLAGEDFLTVAHEISECNDTAPDLGEFARGQMVPEFELVVFSMKPGEISPVFKTQFGLHIATVISRRDVAPMKFEECREQIVDHLVRDLKNDAIGRWVDAEKERAEIEISEEE